MFTPTNISSPEQIHESCVEIQAFIEAHYNADNPQAVVDRANVLESYMALSGKLLADAKYRLNELMHSIFIKSVREAAKVNMQTSTTNKYIDTVCKDLQYLVDWIERINRASTHQLEFSRTIISKLKEEMRLAGSSSNT